MKLHYDKETDSLYIDLNERPSADSREIQEGIVIDLDTNGRIVGIDIQHASPRSAALPRRAAQAQLTTTNLCCYRFHRTKRSARSTGG